MLSILNAAYIHLSAGHNLRNFAICMYFRYRYVFFFFLKWTRHPVIHEGTNSHVTQIELPGATFEKIFTCTSG